MKAKPKNDSPRQWDVTFAPGKLRAVARNGGKEVASDELQTAGAPARIELTTSRSELGDGFDDAAFVWAQVVDAKGVPHPNATAAITFSIDGPGVLAAVDNGDNTSHDSYQSNQCKPQFGRCLAVVKASAAKGAITLRASAPGIAAGSVSIAAGRK